MSIEAHSWDERLASRAGSDKPWLILPSAPQRGVEHASVSYAQLYQGAHAVRWRLQHELAGGTERVIVVADNSAECCLVMLGVLLAGLTLVPIAPPSLARPGAPWCAAVASVVQSCAPCVVLAPPSVPAELGVHAGCRVRVFAELLAPAAERGALPALDLPRAAIWQHTSGTTGDARIVALTHRNVFTNVREIGRRIGISEDDVGASWLPLFHDMGLIGSLLFSTYWGMSLVLLRPRQFVARPEVWLWAISRFRATCSAAPNSAYAICANKLGDDKLEGLELSSWRVAFNGAELVHAPTTQRFCERFEPYGFCASSMYPVYGLAEHTLAAALPRERAGARVDWIDGAMADMQSVARPVWADQPGARAVVAVGAALPGHALRIVDADGAAYAEERCIGQVELRGPSQAGHGRSDAPAAWLSTGDRGYIARDTLYVVGRSKDLIKRAGRGLEASLIESAVRCIPELRSGVVAVFGVPDEHRGSEQLVVLAEASKALASEYQRLRRTIALAVSAAVECVPDVIGFVPAGSIPRTTSGKVKHAAARHSFLGDQYAWIEA